MSSNVIVVGAIEGNLRRAFSKLSNIQRKQNFAFAVVVGDLFGSSSSDTELEELDSLLNGSITIPFPTYFSVGNAALPQRVVDKLQTSDEVCPNLFFLGRKGTIKTSEGIRMVTLGGRYIKQDSAGVPTMGKYDPSYTIADARGLYGAHSAHILITNEFPKGILDKSKKNIPDSVKAIEGQQCVSELCMTLRPRYHFSSSPLSAFEREPFEQPANYETMEQEVVTRFEALASLANSNKANRWLSAFKLDPSGPPPAAENRTASPLKKELPIKNTHGLPDQVQAYSRYSNGGEEEEHPHKRRRHRQNLGARIEGCFFCLHDPNARTHLVGSIGSFSYLTVARGPLPLRSTFPSLGFPGHILIIPTTHAPGDLPSQTSTNSGIEEEYQEMQEYRRALYKMVGEKSGGNLGAVCWEANRSRVRHQHWQFCPVSAQLITEGLVDAAFKVDRENNKYSPFQSCESTKMLEQKSDYFRVWIWNPIPQSGNPVEVADRVSRAEEEDVSGVERSMFFPLPAQHTFDIQFGRKVLAKILQLEGRSDWRTAEQTEAEEKEDVATFREAFKDYDFSLA